MPTKKKAAKKKTGTKAAKKKPAKKTAARKKPARAAKKKKPARAAKKAKPARAAKKKPARAAKKAKPARKAAPTRRQGGLSAAADVPVRALSPSRTVLKVGIQREEGFVYFVDPNDMNIWRFPDSVDDDQRMDDERELVFDTGLPQDPAFVEERVLYYLDKDGDVAVTDVVRA